MNYRDIKGRKGVGGVGSRRPSKDVVVEAVGVVEAPATASFADAICAPAATFGGVRSRCSGVLGGGVCVGVALPASVVLPVADSAPSQDRVRVSMSVGCLAAR